MPTSVSRDAPRLGALDALRFLAAATVVAFHFTARDSPAWDGRVPESLDGIGTWTSYGRLGVPLFFVISGFVILMSSWGRSVPSFVASRVGRLYPAYWVSVLVSVGVIAAWPVAASFFEHDFTVSDAVLNLTMVQAAFGTPDIDGVYWTLWYEARFYLLIALLVAIGLTRNRVIAFAALWPITGAVVSRTDNPLLSTLLMPEYAAFFAGGMLIYLLHREGHDWGVWLLLAMQGAIALHFSLPMNAATLTSTTPFPPSPVALAGLTFLCFALVAVATLSPVSRWDARWMTFAGALTYPLYLLHENLGWLVIAKSRDLLGPSGAVLLAVVVSLLAAVCVHRFVEQPFGPLLRRTALGMLHQTVQRAGAPVPGRAEPTTSVIDVTGRPPRPPHPHVRPTAAPLPVHRIPGAALARSTGRSAH